MSSPAITVLIDTYNHERFIEPAILSVFAQDFPASETEIIVVDDGSTDRTPDIVRKFAPRVRLLGKQNGGQASAFNAGIPEARGPIVSFLDGDDWWAPTKLSRVAEAMAADSSVGIVGNGIVLAGMDGTMRSEVLVEGFRFRANTPAGARLFCIRKSFLGTSRMTIRRDLLSQIGRVPEVLALEADEYLFTLAAALSNAQILPEALTYYRIHESNGFQMSVVDPVRLRKKNTVLDALAKSLGSELLRRGIDPPTAKIIAETTQTEADQVRLLLGDGTRAETVRTEWRMYNVLHPTSTLAHRTFKILSLLPALLLDPKSFYKARSRLVASPLYRNARARILPNPTQPHIENAGHSKP